MKRGLYLWTGAFLGGGARFVGIAALIRHTIGRRRATIINYHDPDPTVFDAHLAYLRRNYHIISLTRLVDAMEQGRFDSLPDRSLIITLDDGHRGNARLREVIARHDVPVLIYLVSGLIGKNRRFWFNITSGREKRELKSIPDAERRAHLRRVHGHDDQTEYAHGDTLDQTQIAALPRSVEFGSHTVSHAILTRCETPVAQGEIEDSKRALELLLARRIDHFAYPNGDCDQRVAQLVASAQYRSARTVKVGWVGASSNRFALPNMSIDDDAPLSLMVLQVSGIWGWMKELAKANPLYRRHTRRHKVIG